MNSLSPLQFKATRKLLFFSIDALATEWGVAPRSIRRWEDGTLPIPATAAYALRLMLENANGEAAQPLLF